MTDPTVNPFTGQPIFSAFSPMLPEPPAIPNGEEIYDKIMGGIEPDLTTAVFPTLGAKYAAETPEQHAARQERYQHAMEEYQKQAAAYMDTLKQDVRDYGRANLQMSETVDRHEEDDTLDSITSAMGLL